MIRKTYQCNKFFILQKNAKKSIILSVDKANKKEGKILVENITTKEQLFELESKPMTDSQKKVNDLICLAPVLMGILCELEYYCMVNYGSNRSTNVYGIFVGVFIVALFMRVFEKTTHTEYFNSLLSVMIYGFFIRNYITDSGNLWEMLKHLPFFLV